MAISLVNGVAAGNASSNGGDVNLTAGTLMIEGDACVLSVETANQPISTTALDAQGFVHVLTQSNSDTCLQIFFKEYMNGSETVVTLPDAGDHFVAAACIFRSSAGGVIKIGASNTANQSVSSGGTANFPNITTTQPNAHVFMAIANPRDTDDVNWWTGPGQSGLDATPYFGYNRNASAGNGGGLLIMLGDKASPGSISTPYVTAGSSGTNFNTSLATLELYEAIPPTITSQEIRQVLHGTPLSHTMTANQTVTWAISTGFYDADDFEMSGSTLRFVGNANANYDSPTDANSDNVYEVNVEATNTTTGLTASQNVTIQVAKILYVGGKTYGRAGATSTANSVLTDIAGGIGGGLQQNDYVLIFQHVGGTTDLTLAQTTGYTKHLELYANGTSYDSNFAVFGKFMGSTPDSNTTFGSSGSANNAQSGYITVWRGVDTTTPLDVSVVSATFTGTPKPDPPSITPSSSGAVVVMAAGFAAATTAAVTSPGYLDDFRTLSTSDTVDSAIGGGYFNWTSGAFDGSGWTGGGSANAANASSIIVVALRPAGSGPTDITGTLSATESATADTAASSGTVFVTGTLSPTESGAPDILAAVGTVQVSAALAATDPATPDTAALSGTVTDPSITGSLAATESANEDAASFSGTVAWPTITGNLAAPEDATPDTAALSGTVYWTPSSGTLAATESATPDQASLAATLAVTAALAATESSNEDAASFTGVVTDPGIVGSLAATESATADTAVLNATVQITGTATLAESATPDTASLAGTNRVQVALSTTETGSDTAALSGTVAWPPRTGTLAAVEDSSEDIATLTGTLPISATLAASETGSDLADFDGLVNYTGIAGSLSATESNTPDTASLNATVPITVIINAQESATDTAAINGTVPIQASLVATELPSLDTAAATGSVAWPPISGSLNANETGTDQAQISIEVNVSGYLSTTEDPTPDTADFVATSPLETFLVLDAYEDPTPDSASAFTAQVIVTAYLNATEIGDDHFFAGVIHATSFSVAQPRHTSSLAQIRHTESESEPMGTASEPQIRATASEPQNRHTVSLPQPRETP